MILFVKDSDIVKEIRKFLPKHEIRHYTDPEAPWDFILRKILKGRKAEEAESDWVKYYEKERSK